MMKSIWFYLLVGAVVVVGGYYVVNQYVTVNNHVQAPASQPSVSQPQVVNPPVKDDAELNRKRQEGIGSIDKLKPVEIPPAPKRGDGK
jgi:hypothetical protein